MKKASILFLANIAILVGFLGVSFQFGPLLVAETKFRMSNLLGIRYRVPPVIITSNTQNSQYPIESNASQNGSSAFGSVLGFTERRIVPVSTDFGIVIEKIDANAKVIPDIDPGDEKQYSKALAKGVAAAKGSSKPGEEGNLYIFSHSADAPWNIVRYNAVFYLLRELEAGDRIVVFYKGRRYDYAVFDKTIISPDDVSYLNNRYDKPVLTLQTCDPPGTLKNRLIVRARLAGV